MSFWSPFDDPEEEAEYVAQMRAEHARYAAREAHQRAIRQAAADAFKNCNHENESAIYQVIDGQLVTFMCCPFCGNEKVSSQQIA